MLNEALRRNKLVWIDKFGLPIFQYPCPINGFFFSYSLAGS